MTVESTKFVGPITFSNRQHLMLNMDTLYDDQGSYYAIIPRDTISIFGWSFTPCFSPNDSNLMFSIGYVEPYPISLIVNNFIFSLRDSSLMPVDTIVKSYSSSETTIPQWSSDTSFVFAASDSCIGEYFIGSRRIDTLVRLHNYNKVISFAYNTKENILAYSSSIGYIVPESSPLIYFHYRDSTSDFLAFSPSRDDSTCKCMAPILTSLCWSPDYDKLGFIGYGVPNDLRYCLFLFLRF